MIALAEQIPGAAADRPGRTIEELTRSVSASRLSTWQQCRLKFFYRYMAGIEKALSPALHFGSTVHTVLQQWNLARWRKAPLDNEAIGQVFAQAWNDQVEMAINWNGEEEAARENAWNVLETYFRDTPIAMDEKPEGVEVGVEVDLGSHGLPKLIGVIDLVRQGGLIVDFKTAARTPDAEKIAHTTETQTTSYGVLYREATGEKESGIELHHLIKTKTPKLVVNAFAPASADQITRLFHVIDAYVNGLERQDFVPSPGLQCSSCEFFNECRAWK